jgi:acyl-CoA dehydrogenase
MQATREADRATAARDFDRAFWGHVRFTIANAIRSLAMGLTGSHWVSVPAGAAPENRRYYQQLARFSAMFAFLSDVSMLVLGGGLKRREKLSARLGDILSLMYLASATLKRYEDEGRPRADKPLLDWAIWDAMFRAQNAFEGVISNYPSRVAAWWLRRILFPLGRPYVVPSDRLGHEVAKLLIEPSATRDRLTAGMYVTRGEADIIGKLEAALEAAIAAEGIERKLRDAQKAGRIAGEDLPRAGLAAEVIAPEEHAVLARAARLRDEVIRVDDFPPDLSLAAETRPAAQRAVA